jgi:hypothetical protein
VFPWNKPRASDDEAIRFGMAALEHLPLVKAPEAIWTSIETALSHPPPRVPASRFVPRLAFAALAMLVAAAAYWIAVRRVGTRWEVVEIHGQSRTTASIGAGEWIATGRASSAVVKIGEIGSVDVSPDTRVQVIALRPDDHRLSLAHGEIHAKISAPPRLFFVETPSGTAVDLGCEYSLQSSEDGSGLLQVTRGWVSFQWKGLESLVPAGASCRTLAGAGPGIPYFDDAPEKLRFALDDWAGRGSLDTILSAARVRDTLTLWHLLWRVNVSGRERVYNRMAELTPVPAGVSREKAIQLDRDTLAHWKDELAWTW